MIFERTVAQWLTSLRKDGFTALMIDELNKHTANIKYRRLLNLDEGVSPRWDNIADLGDDIEAKSKAAYAISHLLGSWVFQRLRKCQAEACDRFFLGPSNAKWCSPSCGSRSRGRDKRKRDRETRVLPGT
jgi:predicted RNA-binding Zn ribbon-like protein